jgi:hypothetical protein
MWIGDIRTGDSPLVEGALRVSARLRLDGSPRDEPERVFFDVPRELVPRGAEELGDPWAAAMLPLAMFVGEPLVVEAAVDPALLARLDEWGRVFACWYPRMLRRVELRPLVERAGAAPPGRARATFFSGGIDSWFNVLRGAPRLLVFAAGFDVPLGNAEALARLRAGRAEVARALGIPAVEVATNLRQDPGRRVPWGEVSHGAALAGCAHFLTAGVGVILVGSSAGYADLTPWGSHPLTDPLLSSSALEIRHFGADAARLEKTAAVAASPLALRHLRVCYRTGGDANCGACGKCLRTRITFELLGAGGACETLPPEPADPRAFAAVIHEASATRLFFAEIRELAAQKGRFDVVRAVDSSIARSDRFVRRRDAIERLARMPLAWRLRAPLQRWLASGQTH